MTGVSCGAQCCSMTASECQCDWTFSSILLHSCIVETSAWPLVSALFSSLCPSFGTLMPSDEVGPVSLCTELEKSWISQQASVHTPCRTTAWLTASSGVGWEEQWWPSQPDGDNHTRVRLRGVRGARGCVQRGHWSCTNPRAAKNLLLLCESVTLILGGRMWSVWY